MGPDSNSPLEAESNPSICAGHHARVDGSTLAAGAAFPIECDPKSTDAEKHRRGNPR